MPACKKGCNACCESVTVLARPEEMAPLVRAINRLDKNVRKNIALKIKDIDTTWISLPKHIDSDKYDAEKSINHLRELAYRCPLLGANGYLIYNDRPLACRAYFSTNPNLCINWSADINLISNFAVDIGWRSLDDRIVLPMPLFRNIDYIDNRFVDLTKGKFYWARHVVVCEDRKTSLIKRIMERTKLFLQKNKKV